MQIARRIEREINEDGVFSTFNPDFGNYVRVNTGTATYRFICQMKS